MPELPEVETARRGLAPHLAGRRIAAVRVRQRHLRWPVPAGLGRRLAGTAIEALERRAKYLLLRTEAGTVLLHLGMSGSLRLVPAALPPDRHEHLDLVLDDGRALRLRDPRRFGAVLWAGRRPEGHPLLAGLGPEPLGPHFHGEHLHRRARGRRVAVKPFLMDARVVAGVGNIYATEALFRAGVDPRLPAGRLRPVRWERVAGAVREVLEQALAAGGTTLRDFVDARGRPGWFARELAVYGRAGEPCPRCGTSIRCVRLGQRSSYWCPSCQR